MLMSDSNLSPKSSAVLPIKGYISTVGGCLGSPEDRIAVPTSEELYILNLTLSLDENRSKKIAISQEVNFTYRGCVNIELEPKYVSKGSQVDDEIKIALRENVNRSVLFPNEQTTRDVLKARNGVRLVSWSPRGVDKYERCIMSLTTLENRSVLCTLKGTESWEESVDISLIWQQYYIKHGRIAQGRKLPVDSQPQFIFQPSECASIPSLICENVTDYFDAVEDVMIIYTSWCHIIRRPEIKSTNSANFFAETTVKDDKSYYTIPVDPEQLVTTSFSMCSVTFLAVLKKSGTFSIWMVAIPFLGMSSVSLLWVDYTYTVVRSDVMDKRPNYIKLYDLDNVNLLLILGFTDGSVKGLVFPIDYSPTGILVLTTPYLFNLWTTPLHHVSILSSAWSMHRGLLCIGYGRHLLLFHIDKETSDSDTQEKQQNSLSVQLCGRAPLYLVKYQFVSQPNPILGQITGIYLDDERLLLTSMDGYLMHASVDSISNCELNWRVVWCSSTYEKSDVIHWEFHGLFVSMNGVYICFLEKPCNYLDNSRSRRGALLSSRVRFLSFWSNDDLQKLAFNPEPPLNRKVDCLQELLQRWYVTEDKDDGMIDNTDLRQLCLQKIDFPQACITGSSLPHTWLEKPLTTLQLYRLILCMLVKDTDDSIKSCAQLWLVNVDQLIQQRHLERCFRLFLQSSVQRQARDCLLVSHMATLTSNVFKPKSSVQLTTPANIENPSSSVNGDVNKSTDRKQICFVEDLPELAEKVRQLAVQLYVHRFKLPAENIVNQAQTCPICKENVIPDLVCSNCPQNHPLERCMQTLETCTDPIFRHCSQCNHVALGISPHGELHCCVTSELSSLVPFFILTPAI
ncbi:unnamed protein product [Heterobilharzia americana]|nr:unnamed protein product [Heterobilharzia americana]